MRHVLHTSDVASRRSSSYTAPNQYSLKRSDVGFATRKWTKDDSTSSSSDVAMGILPALLSLVSAGCRERRHAAAASCSAASRAATAEPRGALVAARSKPRPVNRACASRSASGVGAGLPCTRLLSPAQLRRRHLPRQGAGDRPRAERCQELCQGGPRQGASHPRCRASWSINPKVLPRR